MKQGVLLIDGDMYLHRCIYVPKLREFRTKDGVRTGILYGVLNSLFGILDSLSQHNIVEVYFLLSTGKSFRVAIDENYKLRPEKPDDTWNQHDEILGCSMGEFYKEQKDLVKSILPKLGIKVLWENSYEADDLAGFISRMNLENKRKILVSDDYDWCQLVKDDVDIFRATKQEYISLENFQEVLEVESPKHHCLYLSILGGHDNIPSVLKGFGQVSVKKMLSELSTPTIEGIQSWSTMQRGKGKLLGTDEVISRLKLNLELVDLSKVNFDLDSRTRIKTKILERLDYSQNEINDIIQRYEFYSFSSAMFSSNINKLFYTN